LNALIGRRRQWEQIGGYRAAHLKYYLPNEDGFWEATWYDRGDGVFAPIACGAAQIGFQICTDLWFMERAKSTYPRYVLE
jgi:predicted amidohydrolase